MMGPGVGYVNTEGVESMKPRREVNPFVVGGVIFGVLVVVLLIITIVNLMRGNPYGAETRIDNLSEYYDNLEQNQKNLIYHKLYNMLAENVDTEVPENGAMVREGTAKYNYDAKTNVYNGEFIVDVPSVSRSFRVTFEWSPDGGNQELSGYPVMVMCLKKELQIYENTGKCTNVESESVTWTNEYQIDYSLSSKSSYEVREAVGDYLAENVEATDYSAEIVETSLRRLKGEPDVTYRFDVMMDGVTYGVVVREDTMYGEQYIAILLSWGGDKVGFVLTDDVNMRPLLNEWLLGLAGVESLEVVELPLKR